MTSLLARAQRRKAATVAEIVRKCERERGTLWIDARWYEVLTRDEVEAIVTSHGFGPLQSTIRRTVFT